MKANSNNKLSLVDAVRGRPGMYVGNTDDASGLHHLVWEVLANSIDETVAGHATDVVVELHSDGSISIADNGRGIPVHEVEGIPFPEVIATQFHTSPTADGHSPHVHVALSGVGISPVCALSEWLELETRRDGRIWALRTERGVLVQHLEDLGPSSDTGTSIRLLPDPAIFKILQFSPGLIEQRLRELVALTPDLQITLRSDGSFRTLHAPNGLVSLLSGGSESLSAIGEHGRFSFDLVWNWEASELQIDAFVNWQRVGTEGSHVRGLLAGLGLGQSTLSPELERLHAVLHVRTTDLNMIYGPTRSELRDDELEAAIMAAVQYTVAGHGESTE